MSTPSANNPPPPGLPPVSDMLASDGVFTETLRVMGNLSLDKASIPAVDPPVANGSEANPFASIATMIAATDIVLNGPSGVIYVADGTVTQHATLAEVTVSNSAVNAGSVILFSFNTGTAPDAGEGTLVANVTSVSDGSFKFRLSAVVANGAELLKIHFVVL